MQLHIDKEFEKLIPPLQEIEFKQLEENILTEGCREALITWNGVIVDGHNRYKICTKHGISFKTEERQFPDKDEAKIWIIKNQFGRRNLIPFQRAELALVLKPLIAARAKEKQVAAQNNNAGRAVFQKSDKQDQPIHTDEEIAKHAGVSRDTIRKVETIKKEGTPEQIERARAGGKGNTVNSIYTEIVQKGETERMCDKCGKTLPVEQFYGNRKTCRACLNLMRNTAPSQDKKQLIKTILDVSEETRNLDKPIEYTIDDFVEELSCLNQDYLQKLRRALGSHTELLKEKGDKQKIIAVLSEAETAINKVKELFK